LFDSHEFLRPRQDSRAQDPVAAVVFFVLRVDSTCGSHKSCLGIELGRPENAERPPVAGAGRWFRLRGADDDYPVRVHIAPDDGSFASQALTMTVGGVQGPE
jgi:hypothetical protein